MGGQQSGKKITKKITDNFESEKFALKTRENNAQKINKNLQNSAKNYLQTQKN